MKSRLKLYKTGIALVFVCLVFPVKAQQQDAFPRIDSLTYRQYLDKDWKNLEKSAKKARRKDSIIITSG